jgi:hypothetical protein
MADATIDSRMVRNAALIIMLLAATMVILVCATGRVVHAKMRGLAVIGEESYDQ